MLAVDVVDWRVGMGIRDPCRLCGMYGFYMGLGLAVSPASRGLSPPMCVPACPVRCCEYRPASCEGCGLGVISDGLADDNRPQMRRRPMAW